MKIISILLFAVNILFAQNKDILWVEYDLVPTSILSGTFKDQGINQKVRRDIQHTFDSYDYTVEENVIARMMKMYQKYPNICGIITKSKSREAFIYFSKAFNWALPNGMIIREDDLGRYQKYLNSDNEIILEELLKSKKFTIGYIDKRVYGNYLDKLIQDNNDFMKLTTTEEKQMELLVKYKRIDALLGFPMKAGYFSKKRGYNILYLPISNLEVRTVHIGCSKSKLGKQFINEINPYIVEQRTKQFLEYNLEWLDTPTQNFLKEKIEVLAKDTNQ